MPVHNHVMVGVAIQLPHAKCKFAAVAQNIFGIDEVYER